MEQLACVHVMLMTRSSLCKSLAEPVCYMHELEKPRTLRKQRNHAMPLLWQQA